MRPDRWDKHCQSQAARAAAEEADRRGYAAAVKKYGSSGATFVASPESMRLWLRYCELSGDARGVRHYTKMIAECDRHRAALVRVQALLAGDAK